MEYIMYIDLDTSILQCRTTTKIVKVLNDLLDNPDDKNSLTNAESVITQWHKANSHKHKKGNYEKTIKIQIRQNNQEG